MRLGKEADRDIDQICRDSGIRLITIDRPGCGHVPSVPLSERLDISCSQSLFLNLRIKEKGLGSDGIEHIISVLKYLGIELRHLIAFSTGV
jgi:hypothetical protein